MYSTSSLATSEALAETFGWRNIEGGCLVIVERA
jgi:hypothetical protein